VSSAELKQRLAAILVADAAGYSRLMELDERATIAELDAARALFRSLIESNQGRVIDMAGDSVLAIFETVSGAVGTAIAVQEALGSARAAAPEERRMRFRSGVHLGDVFEEPDGTIYGDGVNIAARLQALAEPGGIMVSDLVHGAVRGKVGAAFAEHGACEVKNIGRPITAFRLQTTEHASAVASLPASGGSPASARPSVAVLPFDNMSGDASQTYLADGVAEDLITALSRYHWLRVVARNSSFALKGRPVDVRRAAKELEANYIVEGSVRRAGNQLRVAAQLVDGATGEHIWAERYDREWADLFALQDEITSMVVGRLEPQLERVEQQRAIRKPTQNLGAWDCYHIALSHMYRFTPEGNAEAQRLLRRAIEFDPRFAQAHARLAYCTIFEMVYFDARPAPEALDEALRLAQNAVALDAEDAFCQMALGRVHIARRDYELGLAACEAALALNPNMGIAYCGMGDAFTYAGRLADAIPCFEEAIRLSPNDPWRWAFYSYGALALILVGRLEQAVEWAQKAILVPNCQYWARAHLAVALGYLGRTAEAAATLADLKKLRPEFSFAFVREKLFYLENSEQVERYLEGLRHAGWTH
jgi:TolB-like protein/Tfp pilus assembly protein PilF